MPGKIIYLSPFINAMPFEHKTFAKHAPTPRRDKPNKKKICCTSENPWWRAHTLKTRNSIIIPNLHIYIYINDTLIHTYNNYILAALRASSFGEENMNTLLRFAPHTPGNAARAYKACGSFVESECAAQLFRYITNPWAHKHHHHHRIQLFNSFFFSPCLLHSFAAFVHIYNISMQTPETYEFFFVNGIKDFFNFICIALSLYIYIVINKLECII